MQYLPFIPKYFNFYEILEDMSAIFITLLSVSFRPQYIKICLVAYRCYSCCYCSYCHCHYHHCQLLVFILDLFQNAFNRIVHK
jgi:hypothetical protein